MGRGVGAVRPVDNGRRLRSADLEPLVEDADHLQRATRPLQADPSMVITADTPLTDEFLGTACPDQGWIVGQDVVDERLTQRSRRLPAMTTVAYRADHAGYELKQHLIERLSAAGFDVIDHGTHSAESVDYPEFCAAAARSVRDGKADVGIVLGGSARASSSPPTRSRAFRAALCNCLYTARCRRQHNDANVLSIGAPWSASGSPTRSSTRSSRPTSKAGVTPAASLRSPSSRSSSRELPNRHRP